jgi:hypothetical protein
MRVCSFPKVHWSLLMRGTSECLLRRSNLTKDTVRGISLDERVYRNPKAFYPDRYLPKPEGYGEPLFVGGFGYGRRCIPTGLSVSHH